MAVLCRCIKQIGKNLFFLESNRNISLSATTRLKESAFIIKYYILYSIITCQAKMILTYIYIATLHRDAKFICTQLCCSNREKGR